MSDPAHPTNETWELFDPEIYSPPRGVNLLMINPGGVLIVGTWIESSVAWGFKPRIPQTVKDRMEAKWLS